MSLWRVLLATLLLAVLPAGAYAQAKSTVLGAILPLTGSSSELGQTTKIALEIAVAMANATSRGDDKPLRLEVIDSKGDPKLAAKAVADLAELNAMAIVGPLTSNEARASFQVGETHRIVQLSNAAVGPRLTLNRPFAFRLIEREFLQFERLMKALSVLQKFENTSIVYDKSTGPMQLLGTQVVTGAAIRSGYSLIGKSVSLKEAKLTTPLELLLEDSPRLVVISGDTQFVTAISNLMRKNGFAGTFAFPSLAADPALASTLTEHASSAIYPSWFWHDRNDATRRFAKEFAKKSKIANLERELPHQSLASAYDSVMMLSAAIQKVKITGEESKRKDERQAIRDTLATLSHDGLTGHICFDEHGDAELATYIIEIKDGKETLLKSYPPQNCEP